ncbi:MAG: response regulator transcription factor [Bacteroidetes bacterium]|nr:response regulator transcription factor [Bacteroidota bacterium]
MIYLFIIEDHPIVIDGFINWFKDPLCDIKISGITDSVNETIANLIPEKVEIIVLDLYLVDPDIDPVKNIQFLKQTFPQKKIIIYTGDRTDFWVKVAFENGVSAYLQKGKIHEHEFKEIIHRVACGEIIRPINLIEKPLTHEKIQFKTELLPSIERKIITMVSKGKTNKQIAEELKMSKTSIDKRLSRLRARFHVTNNVNLIIHLLSDPF